MWKVGIIGTENLHAMAFAKILNLPDPQTGKRPYGDIRVVGVYGPDMDTAQAVKEQAQAEFIAERPEDYPELVGHVAVIHAVLESLQSGREALVERLERE